MQKNTKRSLPKPREIIREAERMFIISLLSTTLIAIAIAQKQPSELMLHVIWSLEAFTLIATVMVSFWTNREFYTGIQHMRAAMKRRRDRIIMLEMHARLYITLRNKTHHLVTLFAERDAAREAGDEETVEMLGKRINKESAIITDLEKKVIAVIDVSQLTLPSFETALERMQSLLAGHLDDEQLPEEVETIYDYRQAEATSESLDEVARFLLEVNRQWSDDTEN